MNLAAWIIIIFTDLLALLLLFYRFVGTLLLFLPIYWHFYYYFTDLLAHYYYFYRFIGTFIIILLICWHIIILLIYWHIYYYFTDLLLTHELFFTKLLGNFPST